MSESLLLNKESYGTNDERWEEFFNNEKTLSDIPYGLSWHIVFSILKKNPKYEKLNEKLKTLIQNNRHTKLYPLPNRVFKAFSMTPFDETKVVFIGQDPYFNCEYFNGKYVPQAMGLSFSVPVNFKVPSSLDNIYKNLQKYGHIKEIPEHGNLEFWAYQGCLMLNAALTVVDGEKRIHYVLWEWFTNTIIEYLSNNKENIVFVLWGGDAYKKINLIDVDRHETIISSHPSGLSCHKPFREYPCFVDFDHFGTINRYLENHGKKPIIWEI